MKGIPTKYNGMQMRSGVEAKYAAFFDKLGWRWGYETREFPGWISDFTLYGPRFMTFVEVKPIHKFDARVADKMKRAAPNESILLVGLSPFPSWNCSAGCTLIGWSPCTMPGFEDLWVETHLGQTYTDTKAGPHDLYQPEGSWDETLILQERSDSIHDVDLEYVMENIWNPAASSVQWKSNG